jgi:predicted permease
MRRLVALVTNLFRGRRVDRDTEAELSEYLAHAEDAYEARGLSPADARRAARLDLGGLAQVAEGVRDARTGSRVEAFWRDLLYALRVLRRAPGFVLSVAGVLALGIGATTAIVSIVNGVLLRPLPIRDGEGIIRLFHAPPAASFPGIPRFALSPANYLDWKARSQVFADMAAYGFRGASLTGGQNAESVSIARVEPNIFRLLDAAPIMGRLFTAEEAQPGHDRALIVSASFWHTHFGDSPLTDQTLLLDRERYAIVGVMPATFEWPAWTITASSLWMPLAWTNEDRAERSNHNYQAIGRLKPGVTLAAASANLEAVSAQLAREYPKENAGWGSTLVPLTELIVGPVRQSLFVLLAAVACLLLIASANVSNLILNRSLERRKEMALRTALGATRGRVIRQTLMETALLGLIAGAAGAGLAALTLSLFRKFLTDQLPRASEVSLDGRVLAFTIGVSLAMALLAGLGPAIRASRVSLQDTLKRGLGRTDADGTSRRSRRLLVGAEVALSLMLQCLVADAR